MDSIMHAGMNSTPKASSSLANIFRRCQLSRWNSKSWDEANLKVANPRLNQNLLLKITILKTSRDVGPTSTKTSKSKRRKLLNKILPHRTVISVFWGLRSDQATGWNYLFLLWQGAQTSSWQFLDGNSPPWKWINWLIRNIIFRLN